MRTPQETFQAMVTELSTGLTNAFPVVGHEGGKSLEVIKVHPPALPDPTDYNAQKDAIMSGATWGVPLKATVAMKGPDGKLIDKKDVRLGLLPTPTSRHTFIINGKEYQVNYQRRLKPGVYTKFNRLGEAQADFNLAHGRNFSLAIDPKANEFHMKYANTRIPLMPVLKHIFNVNGLGLGKAFETPMSPADEERAIKDLHTMVYPNKPLPGTHDEVRAHLKEYFKGATMDAAVNKITIGVAHPHVTGESLVAAASRLLDVHKKKTEPSTKEQLAFTETHGVEDFLREKIEKNRGAIGFKVRGKMPKHETVGGIGLHQYIQPLIDDFFTKSAQANHVMQINPLEMKENAFKISSLGEGAIGDTHAISNEVRTIHPSSMGFIDPVRTPDNARAGVDTRLTIGTTKTGKQIFTSVIDTRTGKRVQKSPVELYSAFVAHDKEPNEGGMVRAIHKGQMVDVLPGSIQYLIPTDQQFTVSTTLVPFLQNTHAHRAAMGAKMLSQAVSLLDREAPVVDTPHSLDGIQDFLVKAPVAGTITRIDKGFLTIRDAGGKNHKVNFPHEFPLNGTSFLHADLRVKVGDVVRHDQLLADNNFTKDGRMALGKNLTVTYMPYKGMNHEDAVIVTASGAKKLTSQHLHTEEVEIDERSIHDKNKYLSHFPGLFENKHLDKIDEHGVVKVGQILTDGDPVMLALRKRIQSPEQLMLGKANKGLSQPFSDNTILWDRPYAGRVSAVTKTPKGIKVTIVANATLQAGDKLCGRHGNKGVVAAIIPDHEAPKTADGRVPDVILNSAGLTSRMNNGQIYEVIAGKALSAMGMKTQQFPHFTGTNTWNVVKKLKDQSGIDESEEMFDGQTGKSLGKHLLGPMYVLKLFKQAETGFSARSGGQYDIDMRPAKGGEDGAKSVGVLDLYSLLAHGARGFLKDTHYKSEYNPEVLEAMWQGKPLPPPKPTFTFKKFESMLQGMGLNLHKHGNTIALLPATDKHILAMSSGEIMHPLTIKDKPDPTTGLPFRPEAGGLFDVTTTGGLVGNKWSHVKLNEPVVNPLYANAARTVLGLTKDAFNGILVTQGASEIRNRLSQIDVTAKIRELNSELSRTNSAAKRDGVYKQLKYLRPLEQHSIKPADAYVLNHIPVVPPSVRPIYPDPDTGRVVVSDANHLYKNLILINQQLAQHKEIADPETVQALRTGLFEAVKKVQGLDGNLDAMSKEKPAVGFLKVITGTNRAKEGFFQSKLLSRRQDVAARGVVVPDTTLGIDEVGIPKLMAMKIYQNHGVGQLVQSGMALTTAAKHFEDATPTAERATQLAMKDFPLLLTRAPSLHKFNLVGMKPRMVDGKSIRVNTLILKGLNMDFDGDQSNIHVPLTQEGAADVRRMMPSNNLFSPLNGAPVHVPSQETVLGLWKATSVVGGTARKFRTKAEAVAAYHRGDIRITDPIEITS